MGDYAVMSKLVQAVEECYIKNRSAPPKKLKALKNFLLHMFYRCFARIPAVTIAFF